MYNITDKLSLYYQLGEYVLSGSCTPCPAGFYCDDPATGKVACADGKYQTSTGQSTCDDCPAGQECPSKSGSPSDCVAGYFSPLGSSTCEVRPEFFY